MGNLQTPPLAPLVRHLQAKYALSAFVETGTFRGAATEFAAGLFPSVATIEINPDYAVIAAARLDGTGVKCVVGDSRVELPKLVDALTGPALFWLDGHSGGGYYGKEDDCPLVEELAAIARSPFEHFIFIDDARAIVAPPPPPFDADRWPGLTEVLAAACARFPYYCVVIEDVLMCVPPAARDDLVAFCNAVRPKI